MTTGFFFTGDKIYFLTGLGGGSLKRVPRFKALTMPFLNTNLVRISRRATEAASAVSLDSSYSVNRFNDFPSLLIRLW
jgi:hypothetical protein